MRARQELTLARDAEEVYRGADCASIASEWWPRTGQTMGMNIAIAPGLPPRRHWAAPDDRQPVGKEAAAAVKAKCGLPNGADRRRLFEESGFEHVEVQSVTLHLHPPDAAAFAAGAMEGMHTGDKLSGQSEHSVDRAVRTFLAGLGYCLDGPALRFPHVSNLVVATARGRTRD